MNNILSMDLNRQCFGLAGLEVVYEDLETGSFGHHLSLNSDEKVLSALLKRLFARGVKAKVRLVARRENGNPVVIFSDGELTGGHRVSCDMISRAVIAAGLS